METEEQYLRRLFGWGPCSNETVTRMIEALERVKHDEYQQGVRDCFELARERREDEWHAELFVHDSPESVIATLEAKANGEYRGPDFFVLPPAPEEEKL